MQTDRSRLSGHFPINVELKNLMPNLKTEGPCSNSGGKIHISFENIIMAKEMIVVDAK